MEIKNMKPEVEYLASEEAEYLVVKGDFSKQQIIKMATEQGLIDAGDFENSEYHQSHFKTVPTKGESGYSCWHHPVVQACKGSYFASVLCQ